MNKSFKDVVWFLIVMYAYLQLILYFKNVMYDQGVVLNLLYIFWSIVLFITMRYTYMALERGTTRQIILITLLYFANPITAIFSLTKLNIIHVIVIINIAYLLKRMLKGEL